MKLWLIWSVEHGAWWKADDNGYTIHYSEAGRYTFERAVENAIDAGFRRSNFSHHDIKVPNETMILAKE